MLFEILINSSERYASAPQRTVTYHKKPANPLEGLLIFLFKCRDSE